MYNRVIVYWWTNIMPSKVELFNFEFNGCVTISECENISGRRSYLCKCSCGNEFKASVKNIRSGGTRSCGCSRKGTNKTHGMSRTRSYSVWANMIQRCTNQKNSKYRNYGGRGISVCDDWFSFEKFYISMGDPKSSNHSIGRIDNDGDYKPENCRWETYTQQANNTTRTVKFNYRGKELTVREICCINGLEYDVVYERLRSDCNDDDIDFNGNLCDVFVTVDGVELHVTTAIYKLGIPISTFYKRRRKGITSQRIINKKLTDGYI